MRMIDFMLWGKKRVRWITASDGHVERAFFGDVFSYVFSGGWGNTIWFLDFPISNYLTDIFLDVSYFSSHVNANLH